MKSKKQIYHLIYYSLLFSYSMGYSISGFITNATNGEPIAFSNTTISDVSTNKIIKGTASDINGYYILTRIDSGRYQLNISIIGFELYREQILFSENNLRVNVSLNPESIDINEVSVSAERSRFEEKVEVSRINISSEEIKMIPAFVESDVFRTLQLFPSVSSANDFNAALVVRGGSPDENLILLDGTQIYNPYHIGGIFSTFNADLIADTEFLAGGFPAEYGNRLSSVLSITSKEGNSKDGRLPEDWFIKKYWDFNDVKADVSLLSSKISAQGPIYKGSWIFSARRTYFDRLVTAWNNYQGNATPFNYYFRDTHFKVQTSPFKYHKFVYSQFNGKDDLFVDLEADDFPSIGFDWEWVNSTKSLIWKFFPNSNYLIETQISETNYNFDVEFEVDFSSIQEEVNEYCEENPPLDDDTTSIFIADLTYYLTNRVKDVSLNQNINIFINDKFDMEIGWESKNLIMRYQEEFTGYTTSDRLDDPIINSIYVKNLWKPINNLSFDFGMRSSKSSYYDKYIHNPRIGIKYILNQNLAIKGMWGQFTQFMFTINQDEELLRLVDFWQVVEKNKKPQANEHYVLGLEYWISDGNTLSFETYYKPYSTLYDISVVYPDPTDESSYFTSGTGITWGLELLYQFRTNKLNGWLGYAYSDIEREIDLNLDGIIQTNSENYTSNYSKPHSLNFVLNYKLNDKMKNYVIEKLFGRSQIGLTAVFSSGAPYTPVIGKSYYAGVDLYGSLEHPYAYLSNINGNRNSVRYPDYFRLDFSFTKNGTIFNKQVQWKWQIVNITDHFNVLLYNWNHYSSPSKVSRVSMFPRIFTFGVNFEI